MEYLNLGKTGLKVSRICLGCMTYGAPVMMGELKGGSHAWALNEEESQPYLRQALDLGINFFDTANVYSTGASEEVLGNFLKTNVRREAVVVATKVYGSMRDEPNGSGLSRKAIFHELEDSLRRLRTDYVDLYQIHREEEREMMGLCQSEGIGVIPWSPLARGRLTRPWQSESTKRFETDQFGKTLYSRTAEADRRVVDRLGEISDKRGVSSAQIALAWMLGKPAITSPIVGATKLQHLKDAAASVSLRLTPEEIKSLEEPYTPHPILGFS